MPCFSKKWLPILDVCYKNLPYWTWGGEISCYDIDNKNFITLVLYITIFLTPVVGKHFFYFTKYKASLKCRLMKITMVWLSTKVRCKAFSRSLISFRLYYGRYVMFYSLIVLMLYGRHMSVTKSRKTAVLQHRKYSYNYLQAFRLARRAAFVMNWDFGKNFRSNNSRT